MMSTVKHTRFIGLIVSILIAVTWTLYSSQTCFAGITYFVGTVPTVFIYLTVLIFPVCIMSSYMNITHSYVEYIMLILSLEVILVWFFGCDDLLVFYIAFELGLLPLYVLVGSFGSSTNRIRASMLLWSYTLFGSLSLLVGLLLLVVTTGLTNIATMSVLALNLVDITVVWVLLALGIALKVPSVPFHIWLPRAHVEGNISTSILLAALILKLSTYATYVLLLNTLVVGTAYYQDLWVWLALISFIHTSMITLVQIDAKTLIAYSSIAHMSLITIGLHTNSYTSIIGAFILAIAHASSSSSLFIIFGQVIYDRLHTRTLYYIRNIGAYMPTTKSLLLTAIVANSATPTTVNWLGELYILVGCVHHNIIVSSVLASTVLLTATYSYWMFTYVHSNTNTSTSTTTTTSRASTMVDITKSETSTLIYLLIPNFILGLYPSLLDAYLVTPTMALIY